MTSKTRIRTIRSLTVFTAGYLPFALLWHSIGAVQAFFVGAAAALAVGLIIRWRAAKSRQPR
jgi:hypothetical protein